MTPDRHFYQVEKDRQKVGNRAAIPCKMNDDTFHKILELMRSQTT